MLSPHAMSFITQATGSSTLVEDLLLTAEEGRLNDVQSLLDGGRCKVDDEDEVCPCMYEWHMTLCCGSVHLQHLVLCIWLCEC